MSSQKPNGEMGQQTISDVPGVKALLGINFFIETNRMEPFVAVYLITFQNWDEVWIGYMSVVMNMVMLSLQTPIGDWLDKAKHKKAIVGLATLVAAITTASVAWTSNFWIVLVLKAAEGVAATIFLPGLMSLLLGLTPTILVPMMVSKTEVVNKVGSLFFTLGCGLIAYFLYPNVSSVFYLLGAGGLLACVFIMALPSNAIDNERARGCGTAGDETNVYMTYRELCSEHSIRNFAILTFLYHLANAGVVPLVAQFVALEDERLSLTLTSASLLLQYAVQAPTAYLVGLYAHRTNNKCILLIAHLVLPIRCATLALLALYWPNIYVVTATQVFDGIGAGLYDTMLPIIVAKMTKGSGRFCAVFGFLVTCWRAGHGFSLLLGESIVHNYGYYVGFFTLGGIGIIACLFLVFGVSIPENDDDDDDVDVDEKQLMVSVASSKELRKSSTSPRLRRINTGLDRASMSLVRSGVLKASVLARTNSSQSLRGLLSPRSIRKSQLDFGKGSFDQTGTV